MRVVLVAIGLVALCAACGDDKKAPGEPCTPTPEGAAECESGVCLRDLTCLGGKTVGSACAGPDCSKTSACSGGMQCVPVTGSTLKYCVPPTLCE